MNILNDLSKRLTELGNGALSKTKDIADVAKLSLSIAEEERNLQTLYQEIGKIYVENHAGDFEEIFVEQMTGILEIKAKIEEYEAKKKEIKKVSTCPVCGAKIPQDANFCANCGAEAPKPAEVVEEVAEEAENVVEAPAETAAEDNVAPSNTSDAVDTTDIF